MVTITCDVESVTSETAAIKRFLLKPHVEMVGGWTAGSHVRVELVGGGSRAYSLLRLPDLAEGHLALGVLLEQASTGGSKFMHALNVGDKMTITPPSNNFPLEDRSGHTILIAGGIGITPILSMAADLAKAGRPFEAHYAGRTEGSLAFVAEMQAICGDRLHLHYDDQPSALNIDTVLADSPADAHIYVCGPRGMIDAVKNRAAAVGWAADRVHFELFTTDAAATENIPFDVEINSTGQIVHVPADKSIIAALEEAGLDLIYDCQRGDCGICQTDVIEGIPDHRDVILTDAEKQSNKLMQICVSRSKTPKLVLDL